MALTKCKECGNEISTKASKCPKCGAKRQAALTAWQVIGGLIVGGAAIAYMAAGGIEGDAERNMQQITNQVASDAETQYQIAKRQGDVMQICVQAMSVSAAYLQAKNEAEYRRAKAIEATECKRAGMPTQP